MISECNYPFLCCLETIEILKKSNVMFIMRGLPGSGKSYTANEIRKIYPDTRTCSADDFFVSENGSYEFDQTKLDDAHSKCAEDAVEYMTQQIPVIIIDNTNLRRYFVKKYVRLARQHGYIAVIVSANSAWSNNLKELALRNTHGLTPDMLEKKLKTYQEYNFSYWGWFFSDRDIYRNKSLTNLAARCFKLCMENIPEFKKCMDSTFENAEEFESVYTRDQPLKEGRELHCTAFYAGPDSKSNPLVIEYSNSDIVKQSLLKVFTLNVCGIVLTPRTVGARVMLSDDQLPLWRDDFVNETSSSISQPVENDDGEIGKKKRTKKSAKKRQQMSSADQVLVADSKENEIKGDKSSADDWEDDLCSLDLFEEDLKHSVESANLNAECTSNTDTVSISDISCSYPSDAHLQTEAISKPTLNIPVNLDRGSLGNNHEGTKYKPECSKGRSISSLPSGSKAHITLGGSNEIKPVQTGIDQLDILQAEQEGKMVGDVIKFEEFCIAYYGEGRCLVTFKDFVVPIKAIFNAL